MPVISDGLILRKNLKLLTLIAMLRICILVTLVHLRYYINLNGNAYVINLIKILTLVLLLMLTIWWLTRFWFLIQATLLDESFDENLSLSHSQIFAHFYRTHDKVLDDGIVSIRATGAWNMIRWKRIWSAKDTWVDRSDQRWLDPYLHEPDLTESSSLPPGENDEDIG